MKGKLFLLTIFVITTCFIQTASYPETDGESTHSSLKSTIVFLSSLDSRIPGYKGNATAANYVENAFTRIGLKDVKKEEFTVTVPIDMGASLEGKAPTKIKLYCLWPNMVRTPTLPPEGIKGKLIYAGEGRYKNYNGRMIKDTVVVLDFNSEMNWLKAAGLGAKAILFIEPKETTRTEAGEKFVEVPLNVPRFMISREDLPVLKKMEGDTVTLKARMDWQRVPTWNIMGIIPGKDKKLSKEIVVLSAYYDSISVVPQKAPGAESACGIAALIEIAKDLSKNPPERSVVILATSAHFIGLRGIDDFVHRHISYFEKVLKEPVKEPIDISLFIGIDLSSHNDELGAFHRGNYYHLGDAFYYRRMFSPFGSKFENYASEICTGLGMKNASSVFVNGISPKKGITWASYIPDNIALDSEVVLFSRIPAISLVTINDFRNIIDTPIDTSEKVNLKNLSTQVGFLKEFIRKMLDDPGLFPESQMEIKDGLCNFTGRIVTFNPRKSFVPDDPVNGAIAFIRRGDPLSSEISMMGVRNSFYETTDENGEFTVSRMAGGEGHEMEAYGINQLNGEIILAPDRGVNGDLAYPMKFYIDSSKIHGMIVLFPCVTTDLYDLIDPRYLTALTEIKIFDASGSEPFAYGYNMGPGIAVVFSKPGNRLKVGMSSGILGFRMLILNSPDSSSKDMAEGIGYDPIKFRKLTANSYQAARDMLNLNEFRVRELAKHGIINERLKKLHTQAKNALAEAGKARGRKDWSMFMTCSRRALGIESRAYPDVKATANDVIKGIIFYMALLIPFSFFMERLVFGFTDIKKQIMGASGIFLIVYIAMRFVHPAFRISNAPEVILLGFVILTLSAIVLSIVNSKFQEQMEKMKQKSSRVYQTDVGRISASGTAFSLGISNMKRRKVRTLLTCITLILLTFTVLSFTSVKSFMQYTQIGRKNKPPYQGILVRDRVWTPIEKPALDYIESEFFGIAAVSPRAWLISKEMGEPRHIKIKVVGQNGKSTFALGAIGLSQVEKYITPVGKYLTAGKWFDKNDKKACILPDEMAKLLGIKPEDAGKKKVHLLGEIVTVIGILDCQVMKDFKDMDNEPMTPVNFVVMDPEKQKEIQRSKLTKAGSRGKTKFETFSHMELDNVIILPYELAKSLGGKIESIAICFNKETDISEKVKNFVSRLAVTIFAGINDKVTVYSSLGMTSLSGMSNLFVPILIASLIVLNTMMGSVYERFKEIGIYSSVGLAPVHIASLFIAESCVFAILGAIAGYLLGQIVAKVLTTFGLLGGLTLNYSSLSAVSSTLVVMAVVLLSTIYPARKAAQMAVPDVTRRWVLPKPEGDIWEFEFPFTISGREILGLYTFFREYFSSYDDESIGNFYTQDTKLSKFIHKGEDGFILSLKSWLAPFDLGVSEEVNMKAIPTGEYSIYEIHLQIKRMSGEINNWVRLNRRFLDTIRKQFLVWRTVSQKVKDEYREEGEKIFASMGKTDNNQT